MTVIPEIIFQFLRISRAHAEELGIEGCGLQLNDSGEFHWSESTISLARERDEVKMFLHLEGVEVSQLPGTGILRIPITQAEQYVALFPSIVDFLQLYRRNRFLRLGRRARLPPWELDSHDSFLIKMSDSDFNRYYIHDPRSRMSTAGVINPAAFLHSPILAAVAPPGIPLPGEGSWTRLSSAAYQ